MLYLPSGNSSLNHGTRVGKEIIGCCAVVGLVIVEALLHVGLRVAVAGYLVHYTLLNHEILVKVLQRFLLFLEFLELVNRVQEGARVADPGSLVELPGLAIWVFALMGLLLCSLGKFVEDPVVEIAVVIKFVVLVDLLHTYPEFENHLLLYNKLLH